MILSNGSPVGFPAQALAEETPIASSVGFFYAADGAVIGDAFARYSYMYRAQPWVATVVDKIAAAAARLSFTAWRTTDTGKVEDTGTEWAKLWAKPCPIMDRFSFWRWTFSMYELYGEVFWLKIRTPDGSVAGFYPMHPARTQIRRVGGREQFVFALGVASAGLLEADQDDVVPFRRFNPDSMMRGLSRVEPLRSTLENEQEARRSTSSWWKRGARPSMMLSTDKLLSEGAVTRLKAQIDDNHAGSARAGGSLVLEEGMKPIPVQLSAEEMQYIDSRKLNREEVCAVYDVPPPVVHILDHATFSNITEQMRSMYRDTMAPRLEDIESVIEHHVLPEFDADGSLGLSASFSMDEVLRGDFETRATAVSNLIERGIMSPDEARPLFNLPQRGGVADKLFANAALQPLGAPVARVSLTEAGSASPAEQQQMDQAAQDAAQAAQGQQAVARGVGVVIEYEKRSKEAS